MAWTYGLTYTQVNNYTTKDGLAPGNAEKIILGSDIDAELSGIATALNSKLDASSVSSTAEAQAGTDPESVMTPSNVTEWSNAGGGGHVGELWNLSDPAADRILFYDFSAGAGSMLSQLTVGTGLAITATTIATDDANIAHDSLSGFVANEHIDHSGVSVVAASNSGLNTANNDLTSNIGLEIDLTGLTQITAAALVGADEFLVDNAGTPKALRWQDFGIPQTDDTSTAPFTSADLTYANRWYNCNNASPIGAVIPANSSVAYPVGTVFAFHQRGAGQVTVSVTTDTLRAPFGAKTATQYSTIFVTKIGTTEWAITGDASA